MGIVGNSHLGRRQLEIQSRPVEGTIQDVRFPMWIPIDVPGFSGINVVSNRDGEVEVVFVYTKHSSHVFPPFTLTSRFRSGLRQVRPQSYEWMMRELRSMADEIHEADVTIDHILKTIALAERRARRRSKAKTIRLPEREPRDGRE